MPRAKNSTPWGYNAQAIFGPQAEMPTQFERVVGRQMAEAKMTREQAENSEFTRAWVRKHWRQRFVPEQVLLHMKLDASTIKIGKAEDI